MNKNYFSVKIVSKLSLMRLFIILLILLPSSIIYAQTIAAWTFETSQPLGPGPYNPEVGEGTASGVHSGTTTFNTPAGNGSQSSFRADNWSEGDYFQFEVSTIGYEEVTLSFDQTSSNTGPQKFEIQVSTDGINFTTLTGYNVANNNWNSSGHDAGSGYSFNLSGMGNQSTLIIRLALADGSTAVNGGAISAQGTSRIDNVNITGSQPLPVTMSSFSGVKQNGKNILTWDVQGEQNISHYEVESSNDGKMFHTIGKVTALNHSESTAYTFADELNSDLTYYRLKIIDMETGYTFSRILAIDDRHTTSNVSLGLNPVQDILPVLVSGSNGNISLKIFNMGGSMIFDKSYLCSGSAALNVDISSLPPGTYILKASAGSEQLKAVRFVKP